MKVILIQGEENLRNRVHFWLENTLQAKVVTMTNLPDAVIEIREGQGKAKLVIFDFQKNAITEYRKFREEVGKTLPIILCLEGVVSELTDMDTASRTEIVNRREMIEGLAGAIVAFKAAGALAETKEEGPGDTEEDPTGKTFCRVRTPLLLSVVPLKGDIFIRLSKTKYLKLFQQGDQFEQSDYEKYTQRKGVEYLFLKRDAVTEFLTKYTDEVRKMLKNVDDLKIIGQSEVSVHEIVHEIQKNIGFTPAVENLVRTQMKATIQALEKSPKLRDILSKLEDLKGDYLHLHSVLTGHIACGLATEVSWATGLTFQKLTMAGFLHDISIEDSKIAKIGTIEEFDKGLHGAEVKKEFIEHPAKAAELVNQFHEVPPDVDKIILQHHERPDQSGFPHKLGATRMYPLACLFILAHEMADFQIENMGKNVSVKDFIERAATKYEGSNFRKLLGAVEKCFSR